MKRTVVVEEDITFPKLIQECEDTDINIKDIIAAIDEKYAKYSINAELINQSISLLLSFKPSKGDCEDINVENLETLLNIIKS